MNITTANRTFYIETELEMMDFLYDYYHLSIVEMRVWERDYRFSRERDKENVREVTHS